VVAKVTSSALIRMVMTAAQALPPGSIGVLSLLAGRAWYLFDGRRRKRIAENLRIAFDDSLSDAERRALAKRVFTNMARIPIETLWFDRLLATPRQVERRCTFHGAWPDPDGPGGVLVAGHLGNWEVCIRACRHRFRRMRTVVRPVDIPAIDDLITRIRGGPENVLEKHGAYSGLVRSLAEGYWCMIVSDQNAGAGGVFVPFFGLAASTHVSPALLARREGARLYFIACLRRPGPEIAYDVYLEPVPLPPEGGDEEAVLEALTAELSRRLEGWVRRSPDQYNFLHRRWKDRPPGEALGPHLPRYDHHRQD